MFFKFVNVLRRYVEAFFYFSTDEVFGPALGTTMFDEWDRHKPTNPYSSSKSAAENICIAYENTYKIPLMIVNVMNAFGERQHPEKFIPLCINKIRAGEEITIHSYAGAIKAGSRWYIHARNIAASVLFVLAHGTHGEKYNVQGEIELDNLELAQFIAKELGMELKYNMHDNPVSRPGHDLRYALDGDKLRELGFALPLTFYDSLRKTIRWMCQNPDWLDPANFGRQDYEQSSAPNAPRQMSTLAPGGSIQEVLDGKGGASGRDSAGFVSKL